MAKIAALMTGGGESVIDFDFVKSVVDSHTHTYDFTTIESRASINEGGVYIDTSNKVAYLYADYDALKTETPSSGSFNTMLKINGSSSYIYSLAPYSSNSILNKIVNIKSSTATNDPLINLYPYNSSELRIGHTKKYTTGENFKVWAVWSIRTA